MDHTTKQHYRMVAGDVYYHPAGKPEELGSTSLNAILTTKFNEGNVVTVKDLGTAQKSLQIQLHQRTQGMEVIVTDVIMTGMFDLGTMTPAEFLGTDPAGHQAAEPTVQ